LEKRGVNKDEYTLLNPETSDIPKFLLMGDVGLLTIADLPTARKAVSVKFGEYLATGLPVICTPFVAGAAQLIRDNGCGIVVDTKEASSFDQINWLLNNYKQIQNNGFKLVKEYLSVKINAGNFLEIYKDVIRTLHKTEQII
jgi:glycosyltransferase involved in cell wall biosynthesis